MSKPTELQTFDFNTHALRVITDSNGEPWFIAKDVADILGYSQTNKMTSRLDDDEAKKVNLQIGGNYINQVLINESGLYSAILGSNKPEAKAFKKHVTSEVLPSIRKTGGYSANSTPYGLKALPSDDVLTLTEFEEVQVYLDALQALLDRATIQITAADYQALMLRKIRTVYRVPNAVLALMEKYGIPRDEICEAANINNNNLRQHLHLARKTGGAA